MSVTIKNALEAGARTLTADGLNGSRNDASLLLKHVLQRDRAFLIAHPEELLTAAQHEQYRSLTALRAEGCPLQYLTGRQEFFKLDFEVTSDVLIPRPE